MRFKTIFISNENDSKRILVDFFQEEDNIEKNYSSEKIQDITSLANKVICRYFINKEEFIEDKKDSYEIIRNFVSNSEIKNLLMDTKEYIVLAKSSNTNFGKDNKENKVLLKTMDGEINFKTGEEMLYKNLLKKMDGFYKNLHLLEWDDYRIEIPENMYLLYHLPFNVFYVKMNEIKIDFTIIQEDEEEELNSMVRVDSIKLNKI